MQRNEDTLYNQRALAHKLCSQYNKIEDDSDPRRKEIIDKLIPNNNGVYLQGPIYFDYGKNIEFGKHCFANFNLTILDICPVTIGDNVFIGPNVSLVTPIHPFLPEERNLYRNEKGRITDKEYQQSIDRIIKDEIEYINTIHPGKVITLHGSVEERLREIENHLSKL